eukprot:Blabericola_migrator_1__11933@NODE_72_length_15243_cov_214_481220_g65_i0_p8_GENE_NODE_72_length_15243_cov_214_481220_g65_i0NODE_72_length_15243_cov_214_481220_g65_i0_p8_ORF_typecomplete_len282_score48_74DinB_2/PF12867_7/1_2e02DinB_2/PF12867_7/0_45YjcZ/PF13990_6/4_8YjcZ/PF13990_6/23_NODE_72_length_15243_cov_214_481220_g65_i061466991
MDDKGPAKLLIFVAIAALVELSVVRRIKASHLSVDTVVDGLSRIARDSFELLTDVSQLSHQVSRAAKEAGRRLTHDELRVMILTESVQEKLDRIKEEALRRIHITDVDHFYKWVGRYVEHERVRGYVEGYDMMLQDAIAGNLPVLPYYEPNPSPSQDEVLQVWAGIQARQRHYLLALLAEAVAAEGADACITWMTAFQEHLDVSHLPPAVAQRLKVAIRTAEDELIAQSAEVVGDRCNFLQVVAVCHRDKEFEKKWKILQQVNEVQTSKGVTLLLNSMKEG